MKKVVFFDLDHTLINNDCDVSWKEFLVEQEYAPVESLRQSQDFFEQYLKGERIAEEFIEFQLQEFRGETEESLRDLLLAHCVEKVIPKVIPDAKEVLDKKLAEEGTIVALLTASQGPIVSPIAKLFGVEHVCSNNLEKDKNGRFTGNLIAPFAGGEGKVHYAKLFCDKHGCKLEEAEYYGDSISDRFILDAVGDPFAVNPDEPLRKIATEKGWNIVEWE